jgi:hypothetical protein
VTPLMIWAGVKAAIKARKNLIATRRALKKHGAHLEAEVIERDNPAGKALGVPGAVGVVLACLLVSVALSGCATASVVRCREAGGNPSTWERAQLNVCDVGTTIIGAIPFCGGD